MIVAVLLYVLANCVFAGACETCSLSDWYPWGRCSESCGGGVQTRQRSLCCPVDLLYNKCLKDLCHNRVTHHDTWENRVCNNNCLNGGSPLDDISGCICPVGWTGKCCDIQLEECTETGYRGNCSRSCRCPKNLICDDSSGHCTRRLTIMTPNAQFINGEECNLCDLRHWERWGSCNQQCGGGIRARNREICCRETTDYDTCVQITCRETFLNSNTSAREETVCNDYCYNNGQFINNSCKCEPGWTGRCCESQCEDGYYGNNCNATCDCQTGTKCEKSTGACMQEFRYAEFKEEDGSSQRLYIILGVSVSLFIGVQILVVIGTYRCIQACRKTKNTKRIDEGNLWIQKSNSNHVLDAVENHYEEIPFDTNGNKMSDVKKKGSIKRGSFRKGSKKISETGPGKAENMYQFLAQQPDDGYQTLACPPPTNTSMYDPKEAPSYYMPMAGAAQVIVRDLTDGGYMAMASQDGDQNTNAIEHYIFDI